MTSCKELLATNDQLLGKDTNTSVPSGNGQELCCSFSALFLKKKKKKLYKIQNAINTQTSLPVEYEPFSSSRLHGFSKVTESEVLKCLKWPEPKTYNLDALSI